MIGGIDGAGDWGLCDPAEPRNRRTRTSILIEGLAGTLLVDTSPDMRTQLLECQVKGADAILYTHAHADHITGLDDVRMLNRIANRPLEAFGTQKTLDELLNRYEYAFRPWQPPHFFRPVMQPHVIIPGETVEIAGMSMRVFDQDHGFSRSLGLRCGGFGYSTDAVTLDDDAFDALAGIDTWVVGCFQPHQHKTHAWLDRVYEWTRRLQPRRTILTHMGVDMDWASLLHSLPKGIEPGHDGQLIKVSELRG